MTCAMASAGPDASSRTMALAAGGTTSVGVTVSRSTRCVVDPKKRRAAPVWPCVPSTIRLACASAAAFRISTCGSPTRTSSVGGCANAVDVTDDARAASACRHSLWITSASTVIAAACTRSGSTTCSSVKAARPPPSGQAPPAHATAWRTMSAEGGEKSTAHSTSGV